VQRLGCYQGSDMLAEDREQAVYAEVLRVVGLGLLEDFVGKRPQDVGEQAVAVAGPAVEGRPFLGNEQRSLEMELGGLEPPTSWVRWCG
jgi:hypothetical protein